jgi:predicted aldo/keto reductase-like oxidoreductase
MGVIGMKVAAQGALLGPGKLSMEEALGYVWSLKGVSLAIVGCQTPAEVDDNAAIARRFQPWDDARLHQVEERTRAGAAAFSYFKRG